MTEFTTILFVLIGVTSALSQGARLLELATQQIAITNSRARARSLTQYKREMGDHFASAAVMLEQLDEHYQRLSNHFAEQSQKLLPQPDAAMFKHGHEENQETTRESPFRNAAIGLFRRAFRPLLRQKQDWLGTIYYNQ